MKRIFLILLTSFGVLSCRQSGTSGEPVHHVSETGNKTSDEVTSGGVRTNPEATSEQPGDTTATSVNTEPKQLN